MITCNTTKGAHCRAIVDLVSNIRTTHSDKHIDTIAKSNYVLTNYVVAYVNATVRYSIVPSWGYQNKETERWDGMIGELVENVADIGATGLFMTDDRAGTIQYIAMPSPTGSQFIFRAPKLSYTDNVFLLPFDDLVWLCLLALVFVTAMFLTLATFAEWKVPLAPLVSGWLMFHETILVTFATHLPRTPRTPASCSRPSATCSYWFSGPHASRARRWRRAAQHRV